MNNRLRKLRNPKFFRADPVLGYRGQPGMSFEQVNPFEAEASVKIEYDDEGFRRFPQPAKATSAATHRIAFLGSSWAWGSYVAAEAAYPAQVGHASGHQFAVYALPNYSPVQAYLTFKQSLDEFRPSHVIVEQHPWTIHRLYQPYIKKGFLRPFAIETDQYPGFEIPELPRLALHPLYRRALIRYLSFLITLKEQNARIPAKKKSDASQHPIYSPSHQNYYDKAYSLLSRIYASMQRICVQKGIKMHLIVLPDNKKDTHADRDLPRERLTSVLTNVGVQPLDLGQDGSLSDPGLYWPDGHPRSEGHRLIAERILSLLN